MEGITGVNWDIKLLLMSAHFEDEIAAAYLHAYNQRKLYNETNGEEGAFVVAVNGSFGFKNSSCNQFPILRDLLDELGAVGILYIGAAPNDDVDINERGDYPTECPSDYLITVTFTNMEDKRSEDASFGSTTVDLGAPGSGVFTTNQSGGYKLETLGGTSYATPHVTGAVALLYSVPCEKLAAAALNNPTETALLIKDAILKGVDEVPDLQNKVVSNGRLNVFNSINYLHGYCLAHEDEANFEDTYLYDKDIVRIYSNPAWNFVTLDYAVTDFKEITVKIYDVLGRLMHTETASPTPFENQSLTVDLRSWANGTYFVTILGFEKVANQPFIKSN
ncbi:MAG: subtilisin family serine protease [Paraglaciecola sp.]|jgi:subtilisin family serine protease